MKSETGGSTWTELDATRSLGRTLAFGSIYQGTSWEQGIARVPAVFRSTDEGVSWDRFALSAAYGYVSTIVVHPTNPSLLYAGGYHEDGSNTLLFLSTNRGEIWQDIHGSIPKGTEVFQLCLDPFDPRNMFAATSSGIYFSTNSGTHWQASDFGNLTQCILADPTKRNRVFAGTYFHGILVSLDGGRTFSAMNEGMNSKSVLCLDMDAPHQIVYAGTDGGGVYRVDLKTAVESPAVKPVFFSLGQNYPNPFNSFTEIHYSLSSEQRVILWVCDIRGKRARLLADEIQGPGPRALPWDGKDDTGRELPSGIYIAMLVAGAEKSSVKMILQK